MIRLPNIRSLFRPDPGYVLVEMDLAGADAQVVAWEADDADLKQAFREGLAIHVKNARDMFGPDCLGDPPNKELPLYREVKAAVHATNYGASARTVAINLGWRVAQAEEFQKRWLTLHPGIGQWHRRVLRDIRQNRQVQNVWGYRRVWFSYPELPEALAWIPQSVVAIVTVRGMEQVRRAFPWVQFLLQVHDSIVFQVPSHRTDSLPAVWKTAHVQIPYRDPLTIRWGCKVFANNWGETGVDLETTRSL